MKIPKIYPILSNLRNLREYENVARSLFEAKSKFLQIREKRMASNEIFEVAKAIIALSKQFGAKVIINDRVDIALAAAADGVHLGQTDLKPVDARHILGTSALIGVSTHSLEQVKEATNQPIDYVAFGPIFMTETKEMPDPVVGIKNLLAAKRICSHFPLVAIGGISQNRVSETLSSGADSVALISALGIGGDVVYRNFLELERIAYTVNG